MVSCVPAPRRGAAFTKLPRAWCCFLIALGVLSAGPVTAQTAVPQPPPQAPASAAELREELQRLRQEFESIRDAYGARLAALESRLGQQTGARDPAGRCRAGASGTAGTRAAAARRACAGSGPGAAASRAGAATRGRGSSRCRRRRRAGRCAAGLRQRERHVEDLQPRHRGHRQLRRRGGQNTIDPRPALQLEEAEVSLQAVVDPYARADFFLAASPEGLEVEEGFITFPTLPGGLLAKVGKLKAQFGKANTLHTPRHAVGRPAARRSSNLLGGDEGLNDSGISVSRLILNPVMFLEATGEIYHGQNDLFTSRTSAAISPTSAGCAATATSPRAPTSISGRRSPTGTTMPGRRHHDAGRRHRRDRALPSAAPGHLPAVHRPHRAVVEPAG